MAQSVTTIGHFAIEERLGEGGGGTVYRARDTRLDRTVALKVLLPGASQDAAGRELLLREARMASRLNHPNIATVYEVGEDRGKAYIAMEYVEGYRLKDIIPHGGMTATQAHRYAVQIGEALAHAHERGIIHRDLKGSNVLINEEGTAKLVDFGLARKFKRAGDESSSSSVPSGSVAGTVSHMAPEVLSGGAASVASDIWSFGVVLYEMATGNLPFTGKTEMEIGVAVMTGRPEPIPARVSDELRRVIERCLQREVDQRYGSAIELLSELQEGPKQPTVQQTHQAPRRRIALYAVGVVVLGGVLAFSIPGTRSLLLPQEPAAQAPAVERQISGGNPNTVVWANVRTGIYHCPGTRFYENTMEGKRMSQKQAQEAGYKPASGKACQ